MRKKEEGLIFYVGAVAPGRRHDLNAASGGNVMLDAHGEPRKEGYKRRLARAYG